MESLVLREHAHHMPNAEVIASRDKGGTAEVVVVGVDDAATTRENTSEQSILFFFWRVVLFVNFGIIL